MYVTEHPQYHLTMNVLKFVCESQTLMLTSASGLIRSSNTCLGASGTIHLQRVHPYIKTWTFWACIYLGTPQTVWHEGSISLNSAMRTEHHVIKPDHRKFSHLWQLGLQAFYRTKSHPWQNSLCCFMTPHLIGDIWCQIWPCSFLCLQITRSDIRAHAKWAVSQVIADDHLNLPHIMGLCGCVWINILHYP